MPAPYCLVYKRKKPLGFSSFSRSLRQLAAPSSKGLRSRYPDGQLGFDKGSSNAFGLHPEFPICYRQDRSFSVKDKKAGLP